MSIQNILKRINRSGGSTASLVILLGVIAYTDWFARLRMEMTSRQFALMDDRTLFAMSAIDIIHGNLWMVAAYVVVFLGCLWWLEFRAAPRCMVWLAFIALAKPSLAYARVCMHIGSKIIGI